MADEIKSLRRNKKVAGVEDPIVIVQRLLNIFRQLHILDEKQKEDFDKMVLQQPPEIRHMCSALPGGSLLQEYVDELEEKFGIAPDQNIGENQSEAGQANILANALADEPAKVSESAPAATPTPTAAPAANTQEMQQQMLLMMQAMQNQAAHAPAGATTIKADSGFAKEIASAISGALAVSDEKRKKETAELTKSLTESQMEMTKTLVEELSKRSTVASAPAVISEGGVKVIDNTAEITKAITESQLEMAKMFLQHNAISASNSNANNANNIQINNAPLPNSQELIGDIIKAQSQLFREMAKEQTKELSVIISQALKESHLLSSKTLVNTLTAFQKENMKFFKQQAQNHPTVIYQQAPVQAAAVAAAEPVYAYAENPQPEVPQENQPSYIKKVFSNMFNHAHEASNDVAVAEENVVAAEPQVEYEYVEVPAQEETVSEPTENLSEEAVTEVLSKDNESADSEDTEVEISSDGLGLSQLASPEKKKKKKKKKKKNSQTNPEEDTQSTLLNNANQELSELLDFGDETQAVSNDDAKSFGGLDISLFDTDLSDTTQDSSEVLLQDETLEPSDNTLFSDITDDLTAIEEAPEIEGATTDFAPLTDEPEDDILTMSEDVSEVSVSEEPLPVVEKIQHSSLIPDLNDKETADSIFNTTSDFESNAEKFDLEADYKISPDEEDNAPIEEVSAANENNDSEWEWEYEEVPEDEAVEASADDTAAADDNGEWEWEYEEVPEDEAVEASADDTAAADDNGEWEWEYEEVPEDEAVEASAEDTAAVDDNGEWEWEYEEVPEDEAVEASAEDTAADDNGEWEWEYEEDAPEEHLSEVSDAQETIIDENLSAEKADDEDFSELFDDSEPKPKVDGDAPFDPYNSNSDAQNDELNLTSLQSEGLYFQDEVSLSEDNAQQSSSPVYDADEEVVLPDWSDDENKNEPYALNSDLKP